MRNFICKTFLFAAFAAATLTAQIASVEPLSAFTPETRSAAHHIHFQSLSDEATCSADAVGPHTLLTAAHCIIGTGKLMVDDAKHIANIERPIYDERDHVLLITDMTFTSYLHIDEKTPVAGEPVSFWGWPGHSKEPLLRQGVCVGPNEDDENAYDFKMPGYPGDSGSGIVDAAGDIITVISLGDQSANLESFKLEFTPEQLASIK
jgi:V8-like Glu-specific endopeptidase